ncbi:unnamed protein product [Bemisia tabaci]|uniref:Uncharacterized protein n=1 Tax=Bemisia tabaci TaxID=7038 RepID=A0A9P0EZJ0_BEMTA|nr:unnamed protein product [Bemisia tabaci]
MDVLFWCVADIQEFYELTLLDDSKSIQQKTAETIRIANKWEASDGPIAPSHNDIFMGIKTLFTLSVPTDIYLITEQTVN